MTNFLWKRYSIVKFVNLVNSTQFYWYSEKSNITTTINNNYSKIYHLKHVPKINKTLETQTWVEIIIFLPKRTLGEVFFLRMTH